MKILMLNYEYPPLGGGGGVSNQYIAEELARRHDVAVVTSRYKTLPACETVRGVRVHRANVIGRKSLRSASLISMLSFHPACLRKGQQVIEDFRPDVINTHFAVPTGPAGVVLARRNRIPHLLSIHGGDIFDPSKQLSPHRTPFLRRTVQRVLRTADRVVAQSANTAENAKRYYGFDGATIVPLGIREPILPPFDRSELGIPQDHVVLATVGRIIARKANHHLIEILARLNTPNVTLVITGDGPERPNLASLAGRLGVAGRVMFPGHVSEIRKLQLLQAADIFVSTTQHEGFGLMYLEGMFCGLPVITYDHGGQRDFLEHEKTGFLVPLNDQQMFQARLQRLIDDPALRKEMAAYNLEVARKFTIERCAAQYALVMEALVSERPAAAVPAGTQA